MHLEISIITFVREILHSLQVLARKGPVAPHMDLLLAILKQALLNLDMKTTTFLKYNPSFTTCPKVARLSRTLCCHNYTIVFTQTIYLD